MGSQGVFFQRTPYINPDQGAGPRVTRFISLGMVTPPPATGAGAAAGGGGGKGKQTFLHALGLPPACGLSVEKLSAVPAGSEPSPYDEAAKGKRGVPEQQVGGGVVGGGWRGGWLRIVTVDRDVGGKRGNL